ncbi:MAG: phosphoesterase [Parcubacteria group bacterium]|nr:phosphoesterase [Parcubacteria group bacterium]
MSQEKIIGIYHKDCLDGTTAAAVLLKKFPDCLLVSLSHRYTEGDVERVLQKTTRETTVFIVDFSLREGHTEKLMQTAREVINIDHHVGAEEKLRALAERHTGFTYVFDNSRSGASLTWVYFYGEKNIPQIILFVEDSDLWRFSFGDKTRHAASYLYQFTEKPKEVLGFMERGDAAIKEILEKGKVFFEYREYLTDILMKTVLPVMINVGGHIVPAHNSPEFLRSDVGHKLAVELGKTVSTFVIDNDSVRLHFRGDAAYSPSALELAKLLGGGGHRNAAGAQVPLKDFCGMIVPR